MSKARASRGWGPAGAASQTHIPGHSPRRLRQPGDVQMTWLIGRRAAVEALQDRLSLVMGFAFAVLVPILLVIVEVRSFEPRPAN